MSPRPASPALTASCPFIRPISAAVHMSLENVSGHAALSFCLAPPSGNQFETRLGRGYHFWIMRASRLLCHSSSPNHRPSYSPPGRFPRWDRTECQKHDIQFDMYDFKHSKIECQRAKHRSSSLPKQHFGLGISKRGPPKPHIIGTSTIIGQLNVIVQQDVSKHCLYLINRKESARARI